MCAAEEEVIAPLLCRGQCRAIAAVVEAIERGVEREQSALELRQRENDVQAVHFHGSEGALEEFIVACTFFQTLEDLGPGVEQFAVIADGFKGLKFQRDPAGIPEEEVVPRQVLQGHGVSGALVTVHADGESPGITERMLLDVAGAAGDVVVSGKRGLVEQAPTERDAFYGGRVIVWPDGLM